MEKHNFTGKRSCVSYEHKAHLISHLLLNICKFLLGLLGKEPRAHMSSYLSPPHLTARLGSGSLKPPGRAGSGTLIVRGRPEHRGRRQTLNSEGKSLVHTIHSAKRVWKVSLSALTINSLEPPLENLKTLQIHSLLQPDGLSAVYCLDSESVLYLLQTWIFVSCYQHLCVMYSLHVYYHHNCFSHTYYCCALTCHYYPVYSNITFSITFHFFKSHSFMQHEHVWGCCAEYAVKIQIHNPFTLLVLSCFKVHRNKLMFTSHTEMLQRS